MTQIKPITQQEFDSLVDGDVLHILDGNYTVCTVDKLPVVNSELAYYKKFAVVATKSTGGWQGWSSPVSPYPKGGYNEGVANYDFTIYAVTKKFTKAKDKQPLTFDYKVGEIYTMRNGKTTEIVDVYQLSPGSSYSGSCSSGYNVTYEGLVFTYDKHENDIVSGPINIQTVYHNEYIGSVAEALVKPSITGSSLFEGSIGGFYTGKCADGNGLTQDDLNMIRSLLSSKITATEVFIKEMKQRLVDKDSVSSMTETHKSIAKGINNVLWKYINRESKKLAKAVTLQTKLKRIK